MVAKTNPITPDPQDSEDIAAAKTLGRQAVRSARSAPPKSSAAGNSKVSGKTLTGGARIRGGRA